MMGYQIFYNIVKFSLYSDDEMLGSLSLQYDNGYVLEENKVSYSWTHLIIFLNTLS